MIEIEGLPEGWKGVAYRRPYPQEYILKSEGAMKVRIRGEQPWLIIEKIQPHRISFDEITDGTQDIDADYYIKSKWWREVKETNIPLNKEEPKLSLSVNDCKSLLSTNDNYASYHKIQEFIKDK